MRILGALVLALVLAAGCGGAPAIAPPAPEPTAATPSAPAPPEATVSDQRGELQRVIDGDTIDVLLKPRDDLARVRLLAIDAPERGRCGFKQASAYVASQLPPGYEMVLVPDPGEPESAGGCAA